MAYPYTRSRARGDLGDSDVKPSDPAPSAPTSPQPGILAGPKAKAVEESDSVSTESAGSVSAPAHLAVSPPTSGSHGVRGSAGFSQVGVFALGYPSNHAGPPDSGSQMSRSLTTGIAEAESPASKLEQSSYTPSRQPPAATAAAAAAETAAAGGPTIEPCDKIVL